MAREIIAPPVGRTYWTRWIEGGREGGIHYANELTVVVARNSPRDGFVVWVGEVNGLPWARIKFIPLDGAASITFYDGPYPPAPEAVMAHFAKMVQGALETES